MRKTLIYACSGCSSAGQMANWIAIQMDRSGVAEMSCVAGVGSGVKPILEKARRAGKRIVIDGCPLHCASECLRSQNLTWNMQVDLSSCGVVRKDHSDFDCDEAKKIAEDLRSQIVKKGLNSSMARKANTSCEEEE